MITKNKLSQRNGSDNKMEARVMLAATEVYVAAGTDVIQDAIDGAAGNDYTFITLTGDEYIQTKPLVLDQSNITISSDGDTPATITWGDSVATSIDKPLITNVSNWTNSNDPLNPYNPNDEGNYTPIENVSLKNLNLQGTSLHASEVRPLIRNSMHGIWIGGNGDVADGVARETRGELENSNILLDSVDVTRFGGHGVHLKSVHDLDIRNSDFSNNGWDNTDSRHNLYTTRINKYSIDNSIFESSPVGDGVYLQDSRNGYMGSSKVTDNGDHGVQARNATFQRHHNMRQRDSYPDGSLGSYRNMQNPTGTAWNWGLYSGSTATQVWSKPAWVTELPYVEG